MECHFQEPKRAKFTKELSEVNLKTTEREVKPIDAALSPTELVTVCFIPYLEELLVMIASSLLNTSPWTLLWKMESAEVLWLTIWPMEQFIE